MICCLNPACHNPPHPDGTNFCSNCGVPLIVLRNRYRPIKSLGDGGFGKTYLAEDIDKLNEHCVIKQFAPQAQGTGALNKATELFAQEARRLQQLDKHPQIPTLLAYFEQDNRLYLVQEFIEGQNLLAELQQQGTFSEQKVRELLLDLLDILKTVHQYKVIHRDIKPENIIRRSDGKLVLIDFGASKQLTATVMTQLGTIIGSFGYAPLEQMQGGEAYPASDLYSVGATCFHLLSGIHPWDLWKRQGYGWVANWRQHLQQSVSQDLAQLLDKLLPEEYQQRYQLVEEVLQDLNPLAPSPVPPTQAVIATSPATPAQVNPKPIATSALPTAVVLRITFKRHSCSVNSVAISPDSKTLASSSSNALFKSDNSIKLWNLVTEEEIRTFTGHSCSVNSVTISPDGKTIVSGSNDKTIKLWNLATGEEIHTLKGHSESITSIVISPDGKIFASGSWDKTIKLWNLATGEEIRTLKGHSDRVLCVAVSPDGKTIISGSDDKTIKLWNLATGKEIRTLKRHSESIMSIAISPDGNTLASGSLDKTIKLWNLRTGQEIRTLTGHLDWVHSVAISPDGKTLASGSGNYCFENDTTIKLWNLETGEQICTLTGHSHSVRSVAISPDGKILASGSLDTTIKIWRLK